MRAGAGYAHERGADGLCQLGGKHQASQSQPATKQDDSSPIYLSRLSPAYGKLSFFPIDRKEKQRGGG